MIQYSERAMRTREGSRAGQNGTVGMKLVRGRRINCILLVICICIHDVDEAVGMRSLYCQ